MDNEPDEDDDLTGDFVSNSDQMLAQMGEVARVSATYCSMLIDSGMPAEVAFRMTADWHQSYWIGAHGAAMDVFADDAYGFESEDDDDDE